MRRGKAFRTMLTMMVLTTVLALLLAGCTPQQPPDPPLTNDPGDPNDPGGPNGAPNKLDDPYLIVVSAAHPLPDNQEPELKTVQGSFKMEVTAADAMIEMINAAKEDGITLQVVSAYRSQAKQKQLYDAKVREYLDKGYAQNEAEEIAATIVARPGTSEHNTGLAADVVTPSYLRLNKGFAETEAAKWMHQNCARFGFILRYPEDKQDITGIIYEPWHFRYVGLEHAQVITENNLCLEEYMDVVTE